MSGLFELSANAALEAINEELMLRPKEDHLSFYRLIATLRIDQRLYFLSEDMVGDQIWPRIRDDEALLDLVLRMTQGFSFRVIGDEDTHAWNALAGVVSRSIRTTGIKNRAKQGVIDDEVSRLTPNSASVENLLTQEPWLLFLLTAERIASAFLPSDMLTLPSRMEKPEA